MFKQLKPGTLIYLNADSHHDPVNLTLLSAYNKTDEYVYQVTGEGDAVDATIRMTNYEKIYGMRILEPIIVAEVDGVNYATLAAAVEASNGADITLLANTDETLTLNLAAGQKFIVGDYTHANVTVADGANGYELVYDSTSKTYTMVDNTASTWTATTDGNWSDGSSWSTGVKPSQYTTVTLPAGEYNVFLTEAASCAAMVVNGTVAFAQTGWDTVDNHNAISFYGNVTGEGAVRLHHVGFNNASGAKVTFAPAITVWAPNANNDSDSWFSGSQFEVTGDVTADGVIQLYDSAHTFSGEMAVNRAIYIRKNCTFSGGVTVAAGKIFRAFDAFTRPIISGSLTLGQGAMFDSYSDYGFTFNNVSVTVQGTGATIWLGNSAAYEGASAAIDGTGFSVNGYLSLNATQANSISVTAPVTLATATSTLMLVQSGTVSSVLPPSDSYAVTFADNTYRLVVATVNVTGLAHEHATVAVTIGDEPVTVTEGVAVVPVGSNVVITWTAESGYQIDAGGTQEITNIRENVAATAPTVSAIPTGDVSIAAPVVGAYGNDFATVSVTAGVTSTYPAATEITYTLKANGTAIASTKAAGNATSVTFDNANVSGLSRYGNISYTVEASGESVTSATSGATTAMLADSEGWVDEKMSTTGTTGSWKTADGAAATVTYDNEERAELSDNKFSATNCSTGDVVTVTIKDVIYTALSDTSEAVGDAQGSIALGGTEDAPMFMVLTKSGNEVQWSEAAGVNPSLNTPYTIVFTFYYTNNTYSITVNGTALTVGGSATYDIVKTTNKYVKDIDFLGAGSIKAIEGIQYDAMMAVDQKGVRYATVAAALDANKGEKGAIIKLLHGTANTNIAGWNYNADTMTFIKKAVGLIFLAF